MASHSFEVIYATEAFPVRTSKSVFLAGPTPRSPPSDHPQTGTQTTSVAKNTSGDKYGIHWRKEALDVFQELGFTGTIFIPEPRSGHWGKGPDGYMHQVEWEEEGLNRADLIVFWIPRTPDEMPAFTTNDEWGYWKASGKSILGTPPNAFRVKYQEYYAEKYGVPTFHSLRDTLSAVVNILGQGVDREGPASFAPLFIWNSVSFQKWFRHFSANKNQELVGLRVQYTVRQPNNSNNQLSRVTFWAIEVHYREKGKGDTVQKEIVLSHPWE